jgi:hypothetical protein
LSIWFLELLEKLDLPLKLSIMRGTFALLLIVFAVVLVCLEAVDRSKFRKCSDTGFCRAFRPKEGPVYGEHVSSLLSFHQAEQFNYKLLLHNLLLGAYIVSS